MHRLFVPCGALATRWVINVSEFLRRYHLLLAIGLGLAISGLSFFGGVAVGCWVTGLTAAMIAVFVAYDRSRKTEIQQLLFFLNRVIHGDYTLDDLGNEEGELKLLKSEIYKMTVRLREQADALEQDKHYLADAIADISHQLRTPLTSMNLAMSLLCREECSPEKQKALLREVTMLLQRMDSLITALLKISKLDAGTVVFRKEPVSVFQVLSEAAEGVAIPMDLRGQTLRISGDSDAMFEGDDQWTVEAFSNIMKNCMEHMNSGGTLTVQVTENALYTEILFQDDGVGIDPEDLPHIFERFYRGKHADSSGFGIGLSLSRMIVSQQNGTIKVANRRTGGTEFTIRFYKGTI